MTAPNQPTRLGFQFFPDALHYREQDLSEWLPHLISLGANWLVLEAPLQRAIPEAFINGLKGAGIQPILVFQAKVGVINPLDIRLLLTTYASWGIQYAAFFDRPNLRASWHAQNWAQINLVERFLDIYLPLAEEALKSGLTPLFPALEPGGDYWDTAFLRTALESMRRRGYQELLDHLVLGAYGWSSNRPLNWGSGGPEKHPAAKPYQNTKEVEDHRGFRIFDWYQAIAQAATGRTMKMILLGAGSRLGDCSDPETPPIDEKSHAQVNLAIAQALASPSPALLPPGVDVIPQAVIVVNFCRLAADPTSPEASQAWRLPGGRQLPVVDELKAWMRNQRAAVHRPHPLQPSQPEPSKPILHYLLLPSFPWGAAGMQLEKLQPFIQKHQPTIGFSIQEAARAQVVTLFGSLQAYPPDTITRLLNAGCSLQHIAGAGTEIASKLAEHSIQCSI